MFGSSKVRTPALSPFVSRGHSYMEIMLADMPTDFPDWMMAQAAERLESQAAAAGKPSFANSTQESQGSPFEITPLVFEEGQPDCFFEGGGRLPYRGQDSVKKEILLEVKSMYRKRQDERLKMLLVGPAGLGKTTLARITAKKLQERRAEAGLPTGSYVELLPAQVATKEKLDAFFRWVVTDPFRIVFVDEVHSLQELEPWFPVLHDTGAPYYPMSDGQRLPIPKTICWLTATTDPGELDKKTEGAMRRRLNPEIELEEPSREVLAQIITDLGRVWGMPVWPDAAIAIAERSMFPWQARMIFEKAQKIALLEDDETLRATHAEEAFDLLGLDELGLLRRDRNVIRALLNAPYELVGQKGKIRYRMSEEAVCSAAGVDRSTYKKRVQPKLIRLGLLTTVGGQSLTERAVERYRSLLD